MNKIDEGIYSNVELLPLDLQGWNGNSNIFFDLINETQAKTIIEVGTWKGQSAINMALSIKKLGLKSKLYCVDTWLGATEFLTTHAHTRERNLLQKNGYPQIYYQFLSNVIHSGVQDVILPIPNTSTNAARYLKNNNISADLIYIDASHEYEDVLLDIKFYFDLLDKNGIIFGDDFHAWSGVNKAVQEFCENNKLIFKIKDNNYWVIRKNNFTKILN